MSELMSYETDGNPPCPECGTIGVREGQEFESDGERMAIVDVYVCPKCHPELMERN